MLQLTLPALVEKYKKLYSFLIMATFSPKVKAKEAANGLSFYDLEKAGFLLQKQDLKNYPLLSISLVFMASGIGFHLCFASIGKVRYR